MISAAAARSERLVRRARPMMGTLVGISARGEDPAALERVIRDTFAEMARLEELLSEFRPDSDVCRVTRAAGSLPVRVCPELIEILTIAESVARATGGAFDCTWAALSPLWKLGDEPFVPPDACAIAAARQLVDHRAVLLDCERQTVLLARAGMRLGLGGVAKAFIAERGADFAVARGVRDVLVDAGGDLVARGQNGGRPWRVGVRHPRVPGALIALVELRDESVVTSGDYERFVELDGQRFHHLLDPRSGAPAWHSQSATVIAPRGALADALATGLFVLGRAGLPCSSAFAGVAAAIVDDRGGEHFWQPGRARFLANRR